MIDKSNFNNKKEWKKFSYGLSAILAIIASIQLYNVNKLYLYFYIAAAAVLLIGLVLPLLIKPIYIFFLYLGEVLGYIMTRIILGIVFFIIMTPIGLIMRMFGKEFLPFFKTTSTSYWIKKDNSRDKKSIYEKQY